MNPICTSRFQEDISQDVLLFNSNNVLRGIDSVDAVAVMGRDPDKTPLSLWREKTGRSTAVQPAWQAGDPRFEASLHHRRIAATYRRLNGRELRKVDHSLRHPIFSFMHALLEWTVAGDPYVQAVLCHYVDDQEENRRVGGVTLAIQIEAQHLMAVADLWAVDVAVLHGDGCLQIHRLPRDDAMIARLVVH